MFGIFPSLNLVRRRLADKRRHTCHDKVKDGVLEELSAKNVIPPEELEKVPNPNPETRAETPMVTTGRTVSPRPLTEQEKRAVIAMQAHLRCEDMLRGKATPGRMDRWTSEGLKVYQHLHQLADSTKIDADTRAVLLGDSREHDFRLLLRVLRERIVDATGLLEDGSAIGAQGQVQGRLLDSPEFQPLAVSADKAPSSAPPAAEASAAQGQAAPAQAQPVAAVDKAAEDRPGVRPDRAGHPGGERSAGLEVTGGRAREHAAATRAAAGSEEGRAKADGEERTTGAAADGRRDQAAAVALVPQPEDGAARGDRSRRRGAWRSRSSTRTGTRSGSRPSPIARR